MTYRNDLGIWGNLSRLFTERNRQESEIQSTNNKQKEDKIETEQAITDLDLANISAEQTITDLDLRVLALESEV